MRRGSAEDKAISLAGVNLKGLRAVTSPLRWASANTCLHPKDPRSSLRSGPPLHHCCLGHHILTPQPWGHPTLPHPPGNSALPTQHPGGKASREGNREQECASTVAAPGWDTGSGGLFSQEGPEGQRPARPPHSPGDTGQVGDEPPEVLLPYSVMVAAGREGEDGTPALVSATCKQTRALAQTPRWGDMAPKARGRPALPPPSPKDLRKASAPAPPGPAVGPPARGGRPRTLLLPSAGLFLPSSVLWLERKEGHVHVLPSP